MDRRVVGRSQSELGSNFQKAISSLLMKLVGLGGGIRFCRKKRSHWMRKERVELVSWEGRRQAAAAVFCVCHRETQPTSSMSLGFQIIDACV
jgi:hypothetical protein